MNRRTMTELRLGALGFGLRGSLARIAHRPGRGSRVSVVAEHDPVLRDRAADRVPGVRTVDDHHKVIDAPDVDAVLVLTPGHRVVAERRYSATPLDVPPLDPKLVAYFERGQTP
jgi:predicted dehydrogenase